MENLDNPTQIVESANVDTLTNQADMLKEPNPEEEVNHDVKSEPTEHWDWLNTKKYGEDKAIAMKKQAMAYPHAEKEMQLAIRERDIAKRELEALKNSGIQSTKPIIDPNNISDALREQIRLQFGDSITAEQVIMQQRLLDANLQPIREATQKNDWKLLKAELKEDVVFQQFPEIIEKLESLPLSERLNDNVIKNIKAEFITNNLLEIIERAKLEGAKSLTVSLGNSQTTETSTNNTNKNVKKTEKRTLLSAEHKQYIESHGGDPVQAEEYLNRKPSAKTGYLQFAE